MKVMMLEFLSKFLMIIVLLCTSIDNSGSFLDFFSILCPSVWLSVCVCTSVYNLTFLKTHNYWLAHLYMWALFQG